MTKQCARPSSLKSRSQLRYTKASSSSNYLRKSDRIKSLLALKRRRTSSPARSRRARTTPRNVHFAPGTVATYEKDLPPSDSVYFLPDMGKDQAVDGMGLDGRDVQEVDAAETMILLGSGERSTVLRGGRQS